MPLPLVQVEPQEASMDLTQSLLQTQALVVAVAVITAFLKLELVVLVVEVVETKAVLLETHLLHHQVKEITVEMAFSLPLALEPLVVEVVLVL
jgi:hypothetical protein